MSTTLGSTEMAKQLTSGVVDGIQELIENQTIAVSKQKLDVNPIIEKQEGRGLVKRVHKTQHQEPTLDALNQIKQAKMMEIREIQKQEDLLKKSAVLSKSKISKSCAKLWKSDFTEQEMNEIKKIKKKQKHYQRQLKKKEQRLQSWLQEKRVQEEQLKKRYLGEQCEQRRKELTKQHQELQRKKKQRQQHLQEQIKKMKELKTKKLLHHQMVESWKKYKQASEQEKARTLAFEKERRRVNSKIIQQHEAKYLELKKDQEKKREKALEESRSAKLHLPYIHSQIFYKVQKEEQEKSRLQQLKTQEMENNIIKKKEYGKLVIDQFLPKLRQRSASNSKDKEGSVGKGILTGQESNKLGNNYMRTIHEKITTEHIEKQKSSLKVTEQPGGNSVFYKNYLRDLKLENQKQNKGSPHDLVEQTLKDSKLSEIDKLHKVRLLLDKDTGVKRSDSDMVETLKSKIKVLNEIMH